MQGNRAGDAAREFLSKPTGYRRAIFASRIALCKSNIPRRGHSAYLPSFARFRYLPSSVWMTTNSPSAMNDGT